MTQQETDHAILVFNCPNCHEPVERQFQGTHTNPHFRDQGYERPKFVCEWAGPREKVDRG